MKDTEENLKCPACSAEMKKVFIESTNFNVDICLDGCGGILFDNREFKHFDEQHENIEEIIKAKEGREFKPVDETKPRVCPICGATMVKNFASSLKEVQIDECYSCGAIFLDNNELTKIRSQFKTEEQRQEAFAKSFELQHDISDFKNYKPKTAKELLGNSAILNLLSRF